MPENSRLRPPFDFDQLDEGELRTLQGLVAKATRVDEGNGPIPDQRPVSPSLRRFADLMDLAAIIRWAVETDEPARLTDDERRAAEKLGRDLLPDHGAWQGELLLLLGRVALERPPLGDLSLCLMSGWTRSKLMTGRTREDGRLDKALKQAAAEADTTLGEVARAACRYGVAAAFAELWTSEEVCLPDPLPGGPSSWRRRSFRRANSLPLSIAPSVVASRSIHHAAEYIRGWERCSKDLLAPGRSRVGPLRNEQEGPPVEQPDALERLLRDEEYELVEATYQEIYHSVATDSEREVLDALTASSFRRAEAAGRLDIEPARLEQRLRRLRRRARKRGISLHSA